MVRRSWKCYRLLRPKGYQKKRSRSHRREFVRGGADPKIRMFDVGNRAKKVEDYEVVLGLMICKSRRLSHLTLEALRTAINRRITDPLGKTGYHLRVRAHPYDMYREHAMMAFAGADRLSEGMRNSFGRPVGRSARMKAGQLILECGVDLKNVEMVKESMRVAGNRVCTRTKIVLVRAKDAEIAKRVPVYDIKNYVSEKYSELHARR